MSVTKSLRVRILKGKYLAELNVYILVFSLYYRNSFCTNWSNVNLLVEWEDKIVKINYAR